MTRQTMTRKMDRMLAGLEVTFTVGTATYTSSAAVADALIALGDVEVTVEVEARRGGTVGHHAFTYFCSPKKVGEKQGLYKLY